MKTRAIVFLATLLVAIVVCGADNTILIHNGFGTGLDYVGMTHAEKRAYVMGAINGMMVAPLFGGSREEMKWLEDFVENMTDVQVAAIFSKYLEDNPEKWHDGLHLLFFSAMSVAYHDSRPTK